MLRRVYIYRQPIEGFYEEALVELCEESWERQGWLVTRTWLADARRHCNWDDLNLNKAHLTARKPFPDRIMASYYKWLAFSTVMDSFASQDPNGGLAVDFDIINYGFTPEMAEELLKDRNEEKAQILGEYGYSFDKEPYLRPPTPVYCGDTGVADTMIKLFVDYRDDSPEARVAKRIRPNSALLQGVDEQSLINDLFWDKYVEHIPYCPMYNSVHFESAIPWERSALVHYTNWSCAKKHTRNRYKLIMRERPPF